MRNTSQEFCVVVDRMMDESFSALHDGDTGSTDVALLRPAPDDHSGPVYVEILAKLCRKLCIFTRRSPTRLSAAP